MPSARDLLQRFRPIGTPGAAAPAGVPADRGAEATGSCSRSSTSWPRRWTRSPGSGRLPLSRPACARDRAAEEARRIVDAARVQAEAERAEAAARILRRAEQETATRRSADARQQAAEIARAGAATAAGHYVRRIVDEVGRAGAAEPAAAP